MSIDEKNLFMLFNEEFLSEFSSLGRAQKNAKHGADDKAKNLMEAMHEKMTLRETTRPLLFKTIRLIFIFHRSIREKKEMIFI